MNKAISFILCSRNDNYMGNPVGRLEIALNYLAENVRLLGREESVEVIVTDWGSKVPLRDILNLNATAAKITRFLEVPIAVVKEVQKDSPFAEVLALNAAARRASGEYIGRIDQDTLVGKHFLQVFFKWIHGKLNPGAEMKTIYLFSKRRQIPFNFATHNLPLKYVQCYLNLCGKRLLIEEHQPFFFNSPVGIMIVSKDLWIKCGGYDERLLYWGWMEVDLAYRLKPHHELLDFGPKVEHDFYHLEHYDPSLPRVTPRKINPTLSENLAFHPNGEGWGLVLYPISLCQIANSRSQMTIRKPFRLIDELKNLQVLLWGVFSVYHTHLKYSFLGRGFCALVRPSRYLSYLKRIGRRVISQ